MKKVSIITIIDNNNFGTFLQAFALCKKVELLGAMPELVDYCRPHMLYRNNFTQILKAFCNPLRIFSRLISLRKSYLTHQKDRAFVKQYLSFSMCMNIDDIKRTISADIYMTGSDQVWNSIHNQGFDKAFYLDYAPKGASRVAYAASIGMPEFQEWEKVEAKALLEQYKMITLREKSSIDLLGTLGLDQSKLHAVIDPTLLLNKDEWNEHIKLPRFHKEKYLLVYSVETKEQNQVIESVAKKIAQERDLKIVGVYYGGKYGQMKCCDYNHHYTTPDVFLSLIYYADYVVVSSFHGTAFSVNFNKEFITVIPQRFNSRVFDLLSRIDALDRMINTSFCGLSQLKPLDYSIINKVIEKERLTSTLLLDEMIK